MRGRLALRVLLAWISAGSWSALSAEASDEDPGAARIRRGADVFRSNCVMCHGEKGDGNGRVAHLFNPRPANLTKSWRSDTYKEQIIRNGGKAMGRSEVMPRWEGQLSDEEIRAAVAYIGSINIAK